MRITKLAIAALLLSSAGAVTADETLDRKLHDAVADGSLVEAERLIAEGADIDARFDDKRTIFVDDKLALIHMLVAVNQPTLLEWLHEHGANLNLRNGEGKTGLMIAAKRGHEKLVETLLRLGADPTIEVRGEKDTALTIAERFEHHEVAELLRATLAEQRPN